MFAGISKAFRSKVNLRRVVGLYRRRLSQQIFARFGGVIQHGAFKGMQWLDDPRWGRSEQGVIILGLYEQEVLESLLSAPSQYRVFVDVGAADGYYAVGLVHSGKVDRSVAFETIPECRAAIGRLAEKNGVRNKLTILGTASDNFVDTLRESKIDSDQTMFLIDIEGAEFKILNEEVFTFLSKSMIVVETHAHIYSDPKGEIERLIGRASKTHRATAWFPGARNPWMLKELEDFSELDRWILCSEGRHEIQQWLRFDPL